MPGRIAGATSVVLAPHGLTVFFRPSDALSFRWWSEVFCGLGRRTARFSTRRVMRKSRTLSVGHKSVLMTALRTKKSPRGRLAGAVAFSIVTGFHGRAGPVFGLGSGEFRAGVAQLAEQLFCKQQVAGSIPTASSGDRQLGSSVGFPALSAVRLFGDGVCFESDRFGCTGLNSRRGSVG